MRVLIFGAIGYTNTAAILTKLNAVHASTPAEILVDGTNRATDQVCRNWAASKGVPWIALQSQLDGAGFAGVQPRALRMIKQAQPGLLLTFGTDQDVTAMTGVATALGIAVQAT